MKEKAEFKGTKKEASYEVVGHLSSLWKLKSPRQILRHLSEFVSENAAVTCLDFIRLDKSDGHWTAYRRRPSRSTSKATLSPEALYDMKEVLCAEDFDDADFGAGIHQIVLKDGEYSLAVFRDRDDELTVMVWNGAAVLKEDPALELTILAAQNEIQWIRKTHCAERLVYLDDLTGLYNTRYFDLVMNSELRRAERFQSKFTLLFIDLDGFKPVNDQYGHLAGSQVLKEVARLIKEVVREVDIPIRYGGDEFIVMLIGATSDMGVMVAERVRIRISEHLFHLGDQKTARVTCSIGVASYPEHGRDQQTLTRIADESMYDSKKMGKNRVTLTPLLGEKSCSN